MKLMKKIAPFAASLLMLGATAAAADLATWKSSFPGADTAIVVGAASTVDTIGAVDLTAALTVTSTSTTSQPVANAYLVKSAGNELNYNEDFADVDNTIDEDDLDNLLAEGRYRESKGDTENDETYEQSITFTVGTNTIVFDAKEDGNEAAGTYLFLDDGLPAYTYELKFDNAIKMAQNSATSTSLKDDVQLTKLNMFGREYNLVDAKMTALDGVLDEITMMAGAKKETMMEYETKTVTMKDKTYTVEVPIISDTAQTVVLRINGEETDQLAEGDTYTLDDETVVGVIDVIPNEGTEKSTGSSEGNDIVTFYLGAEKMRLINGDEIELNGKSVDGSLVTLAVSDEGTDITGLTEIQIDYTPEDNVYVGIGESWTDPVLGRLKYTFQGLEKTTETIEGSASSDDGLIKLKNLAGKELKFNTIVDANNQVYLGDEFVPNGVTVLQGGIGVASSGDDGGFFAYDDLDYCLSAVDITDCEGIKFLVVKSDGEARLFEVKDLNDGADNIWGTADDTIDLKDLTNDKTFDDKNFLGADATWGTADDFVIDVGFTEITIDTTAYANGIEFTTINNFGAGWSGGDSGAALFKTSKDGEVSIYGFPGLGDGNLAIWFDLYEGGTGIGNYLGGFYLGDEDTDGDMELESPAGGFGLNWIEKDDGSDYSMALDVAAIGVTGYAWGTIFTINDDDDNSIVIEYNEDEVVAKAFVSEDLTNIPELGTTTGSGIAPIAVMDDQIDNVKTKNIIAIGGSAINKVAAELLGISYPTYGSDSAWTAATGVDGAGKAVVKLMNSPYTTGKYAMLVAGWEGTDTTRAAKALREGTPALAGMSTTLNTATSTVTVLSS